MTGVAVGEAIGEGKGVALFMGEGEVFGLSVGYGRSVPSNVPVGACPSVVMP